MMILERPRLLQAIETALQTGHLLIEAPAGYGKTTLLHHLVRQRPQSRYVACTPAHGDLAFLKGHLHPRPGETLILDDLHVLEEASEAGAWLSAQLHRDDCRFVLSGRQRLDWLLPPGESAPPLTRLDERTLAFTGVESQLLLAQIEPVHDPEGWAAWLQQLQGWPLGLQLLAQLAGQPDSLPHAEQHLFAYLMATVFAHLPPDLRRFLQVTAVPLRFNDALADHLLDNGPALPLRREAQRRNLFLTETEPPGWFRYHDLIRDFLLEQGSQERTFLFEKTSRWFAGQGDLEMAIEYALAGGLQTEAAALILTVSPDFVLDESRYGTFRRWILQLSEEVLARHPRLLIRLGTDLHYTDAWQHEAWPLLNRGYEYARQQGNGALQLNALVRMASLLFREGRYDEALARARQVLEAPDTAPLERIYSLRMGSLSLTRMARFSEAGALALEAVELANAAGDPQQAAFNQTNLATDILASLGKFDAAHRHMEAAAPHIGGIAFQISLWLDWCKIHIDQGDWGGLQARIEAAEAGMAAQEVQEVTQNLECRLYRAAWATLRNVYSRLRMVLEPFIQSKGINRYIVLDGGAYQVDPYNAIQVDVEVFEATLRQTLQIARSSHAPLLPPAFTAALEGYAPLLPELPMEDWVIGRRQYLADLYSDGCLYAAQTSLALGNLTAAETWAQRAIDHAPWLEEAYAILMRALARQGRRSSALRVYDMAVANLQRELDAPPSAQTQWIAERLRRNEDV